MLGAVGEIRTCYKGRRYSILASISKAGLVKWEEV